MSGVCPLFELPKEFGAESLSSRVSTASEFICEVNEKGDLRLFSTIQKNIFFTLSNVNYFCWIETSVFHHQVMIISTLDKISAYIFYQDLPEAISFDKQNIVAQFTAEKVNEHVTQITSFSPKSKSQKIVSAGLNNFVLLGEDGNIYLHTIFPDGIYLEATSSAENCTSFAWTGIFFAGLSSTQLHIWNFNLSHIDSSPSNGSSLCALNSKQVGVVSGNKVGVYDETAKITKSYTMDKANTKFVALLPEDKIFALPQEYTVINDSYVLPLFVGKDGSVNTIDNDLFIQRLLDVFPFQMAVPILAKRNGGDENGSVAFLANSAIQNENTSLIENYLHTGDQKAAAAFITAVIDGLKENSKPDFLAKVLPIISTHCVNQIQSHNLEETFGTLLVTLRSLLGPSCPHHNAKIIEPPKPSARRIRKEDLVQFVLDAIKKNAVTESLPTLAASFPDFSNPFHLFRTIALQQAWLYVCLGQISDAARLIEDLGEIPSEHFKEMWRQTTRNMTRKVLYDYLHKQGVLTEEDEKHHDILLKITNKYPNTSFTSAQKLSSSPALKTVADDAKLPPWKPIVDLTQDFDENSSLTFAELFNIPPEPIVESPRYFVGNIALIEAQSPKTLKMLTSENSSVERLWVLHCEHRVQEMSALFKQEIDKARSSQNRKLKCIKFVNRYHLQMNVYELETLLDILCQSGYFAQFELDDFELLLVRICKNKFLFDQNWFSQTTLDFTTFFKQFASFCAKKSLFMPFEMFVIAHPRCKEVDLTDVKEPLIRFIWDLWVKRDPAAATLSCMQFIAKSDSEDPVELWKSLPPESLAPLASFVWNKDPEKFKPGSPETEALSSRLSAEYPLLSSLVKGEIPHPKGPPKEKPPSKWRTPIFTSKYDLELHSLIESHFKFDFSKVFTDYYGKTPGQPNYPHFDHPELIAAPSEPPYVHYVKSMLPVSAFEQAIDDGVSEPKMRELCSQCLREALLDRDARLAALTFVELTDIKFGGDSGTDFRLALAVYDRVRGTDNTELVSDLLKVFTNHDATAGKALQGRLLAGGGESQVEVSLLSALLGVRCGLPLDFSPIISFARRQRPAELLLFIDRAAELGAHYPIAEVVRIVTEEMPESRDNPLKDHLLFHLTQSLPTEDGPATADVPPALVVFRAVRRSDQPQHISLLQEALSRRSQLYALLATSVEGSDMMLCALVTMLTMVPGPSPIDVTNPPERPQLLSIFMQTLVKLLGDGKSLELMQALELFSETSVAVLLVQFFRSVELFSFRRAEKVLPQLHTFLVEEKSNDDLLGEIDSDLTKTAFFPIVESLLQKCVKRSPLHVFRLLRVLDGCPVPDSLKPRVELCRRIASFENHRRAVVHCDVLGDPEKVVSDLVLNHSLQLGREAAECLGTSAAAATKQWLTFQYSTAATPAQVLEVHRQVIADIQNADRMFFVALYAALLPYAQPTFGAEIIRYARTLFGEEEILGKHIDALCVHLSICAEAGIEVSGGPSSPPQLPDLLKLLFPKVDMEGTPQSITLAIASPLLFGMESLQRFFDSSVDRAIDVCLDTRRVSDARLLCEWRDRDPQNIELLETVQQAVAGEPLSDEGEKALSAFGDPKGDLEGLLDAVAAEKKWRFVLIALHYKAARRLNLPTGNLLHRRTSEFVESRLSVTFSEWPLVRQLITASKMGIEEAASSLAEAFATHVQSTLGDGSKKAEEGVLDPCDYGERFMEFTELCENSGAVGEHLFEVAKGLPASTPADIRVNLLLHSSLCTRDIDECAETLDSMLDTLPDDRQLAITIDIVSVFPDPALLPRFFQYLIAQQKLSALPHDKLSEKVGRVIMNCARHVHPFEPQNYFDLTLQYKLYRDHAELQMECGSRALLGTPDKTKLQEASRHYLLALAYFLHEKCYSLSMECLKKLSLISLQLEVADPPILHLDKQQVQQLMCTRDFPFALTIAVAFDMDTESNWAEALYAQSVQNRNEDFLTAFQYFRPITTGLCEGVVSRYKQSSANGVDEGQRERMKKFLHNIPNLVERYRIAKNLEFQDQIDNMKEVNPVVCEWCERVLNKP